MPLTATGIEEDDKHLEEAFWNQPNDTPNFSICLADFGESKVYETEEEGYTLRNRGTEFNKSPEMLNVAYMSQKTKETYDRNKKVGANSATDVWALGCLFFELLTGEFLFYDADSSWVRFFLRITSASGEQLITPEKKQLIDSNQHVIDLLHYIFVRDPLYRPSIGYVIQRLKHVRRQVVGRSVVPPVFNPAQRPRLTVVRTEEKEKTEEEENKATEKNPMDGPKPADQLFRKDDTVEAKYFNENCTMILPNLFIGPLNSAKNKVMMKKLDITHFVNLSSDFRFDQWYFETLCIPAGHVTPESMVALSGKLLEFIKSANDGKVLVFCDDGCSLSGAFIVTYLMNTQGWSYFDSYTFLRDRLYRLNIPTEIQR
jgi:serine/threonine protein kinase